MKKLSIALVVFLVAGAAFTSFKKSASRWNVNAQSSRTAVIEQRRGYGILASRHRSLTEEHQSLKTLISLAQQQLHKASKNASGTPFPKAKPTPEVAEQLLSELGYNWNTTGDYLVVSKSSLPSFSLEAIKKSKLTPNISELLAINPEEGAAVELLVQELAAEHAAWAKDHIQRHGPQGDVLVTYSLAFDPVLSQSLSNRFSNGLLSILGTERSAHFKDHSFQFSRTVGIAYHAETSFAITRAPGSNGELLLDHQLSSGGRRMCGLNDYQEFPGEFAWAFPGGWAELAEREHFELPKSFFKK